jgi:large subunit ribosomal protein L20
MPRVKRGIIHLKKRRKLAQKTKGYMWGRKNVLKKMKEAVIHAGVHSYVDRRKKKRDFRALWNIRIGAFAKANGTSYSRMIDLLHKAGISLDRKILADMAINDKALLAKVLVEAAK